MLKLVFGVERVVNNGRAGPRSADYRQVGRHFKAFDLDQVEALAREQVAEPRFVQR